MISRLLLTLLLLAVSAQAAAFVVPLNAIDDSYFSGESEVVTLLAVNMHAARSIEDEALTGELVWRVESELLFRSIAPETVTFDVGMVDEASRTERTQIWVDGVMVETAPVDVRYDANNTDVPPYHARRATLSFPSGEIVRVRVVSYVAPHVDALGQVFLRFPVGMLSFWEGVIRQAYVSVDLFDRPIGLQTSLSGEGFYDEPENLVSWFMLDWQPSRPLEMAYVPMWSMLTLVADRESCPAPTAIVQQMSAGDTAGLTSFLSQYDTETLTFCAALPSVLHGEVFESDATRAQFAAIPFSRYVPTESDRGSIYRENPSFDSSQLVGFEAVYQRTLTQAAEAR